VLPYVEVKEDDEVDLSLDKTLTVIVFGFVIISLLPFVNFSTKMGLYK
jgi:hypothetical protein